MLQYILGSRSSPETNLTRFKYYLGVELLDHVATLCLTLWWSSTLFHSSCTCFHQQCMMGFSLSLVIVPLVDYSHSHDCKVWSQCGFGLYFPNVYWCSLGIFLCVYWPFVFFLRRNVYWNRLLIKKLIDLTKKPKWKLKKSNNLSILVKIN